MGGLGFSRLKLQAKIEGHVNNLRAERESRSPVTEARSFFGGSESNRAASISPPSAPVATKRRRYMAFIDDDAEERAEAEEIEGGNRRARRRLVKKLGDDFDRVASENERTDVSETVNEQKSRKLGGSFDDDDAVMKVVEEVNNSNYKGKKAKTGKNSKSQGNKNTVSGGGVRTSPRLAKRECN